MVTSILTSSASQSTRRDDAYDARPVGFAGVRTEPTGNRFRAVLPIAGFFSSWFRCPRFNRLSISLLPVVTVLMIFLVSPDVANGQADSTNDMQPDDPLATKQKMILDRYKRFEERVFRLQEQLKQVEPENAARLGRVLDQSGELELGDRLTLLIRLLDGSSDRLSAVDKQLEWVEDAERVLGILLERDSNNEERKEEIERLQAFKERLDKILEKQEALKDASAQATMNGRMSAQLSQALKRIEALQKAQESLKNSGSMGQQSQETQESLEEEARDLAEDLSRLSDQAPQEAADTKEQEVAREASSEASEAMKKASEEMKQAGSKMGGEQSGQQQSGQQQSGQQQGGQEQSGQQQSGQQQSGQQQSAQQQSGQQQGAEQDQEDALEELQKAKEALEKALKELETDEQAQKPQELSQEQGDLSQEAKGLSEDMQEGQQEGGGQPDSQSESKSLHTQVT